jgi:LacI family transcriptional regulator
MATIKEVARRARVSVGTVSNVLSGTVRVSPQLAERVSKAIRELDYHPNHVARSLKIKQTKLLGMVIPDITNPFFPLIVRGAEDAALKNGYLLVTCNTDDHIEREKQVLSMLRLRRTDGILLVTARDTTDLSHVTRAIEAGIPVLCLDRIPNKLKVDSVTVDNVKGAQVCVRHLISMGHRRIATITGAMGLRTAVDRLKGYKMAVKEANLKMDPELIKEGNFRLEGGYQAAKELLLQHDRPSALFVANGMMTLGVLRALEEIGLNCPGDIAVATFDDLAIADVFRPHLTVIGQPAYAMGCRGAEILIERLEGRLSNPKPLRIQLDPELKIRESTFGNRGSGGPPERRHAGAN